MLFSHRFVFVLLFSHILILVRYFHTGSILFVIFTQVQSCLLFSHRFMMVRVKIPHLWLVIVERKYHLHIRHQGMIYGWSFVVTYHKPEVDFVSHTLLLVVEFTPVSDSSFGSAWLIFIGVPELAQLYSLVLIFSKFRF